ncbi:MAG: type II toxin-antitoxin system VapC family toxin [Nostoc sp. LPT]|nr:type II toxin-antitoxin system VapC family toxin [Nostoc sp. LPT]
MHYLLDTNILLRACDPASSSYVLALEAIARLLAQGEECVITPQVLIEFWAVATRPIAVNGLGWNAEQTHTEVEQILDQFTLLEDNPQIFTYWLSYVTTYKVMGKRVHDARLIAVILTHGVTHLLTFNTDDFTSTAGIVIVHPQTVIDSQ